MGILRSAQGRAEALRDEPRRHHSAKSWSFGSGSQKLATNPTRYTENPTAAATSATLVGAYARLGVIASVAVSHANDVPTSRPPMFAAKLSPVPRRCTGYTRGR